MILVFATQHEVIMGEPEALMSVESFEALVTPHLHLLLGFALRRVRGRADAEDLVQDTLLRAWDRVDTLKDRECARAWLFTILHRLHVDRARKRRRRQQLMPIKDLDEGFEEQVSSPGGTPLDEVIRMQTASAVHEALAKVPEPYATALELRDLEGFAYKEIAQILGIPQGTALSRVARGRKLMARLLSRWRPTASSLAA